MLRALLISIALLWSGTLLGRHIAGGEMSYAYLGPGNGANSGQYRITLRLYRDCQSSGAQLDAVAAITIYQNGATGIHLDLQVPMTRMDVSQLSSPGPCISNPPIVCYQVGVYVSDVVELPFSPSGYTISFQRCCRIENITNISGSGQSGSTYTATIPGLSALPSAPQNSSPEFVGSDTVLICEDNSFLYDFSARDADGDLLVYTYDEAYDFPNSGGPRPNYALPPPYGSVNYSFGFDAQHPLGPSIAIDPKTGIIRGKAPAAGIYVVTVGVEEWRNGVMINKHRKDLHIKVAACSIAAADLDPVYITCDGFTLSFQNNNNSPLIKTYHWNFGVGGSVNDSTTDSRPTFTFPDTGVYTIRLVTNRSDACSDTGYAVAKVFPGFFPGFIADDGCKDVPIRFIDTTKTKYGFVDSWIWNFGNPLIKPDTSMRQNPLYAYPANNNYDIQLIVTNSKGCIDTVDRRISILDRPTIRVTNDTVLCHLDSMQLRAGGSGDFSWTPTATLDDPLSPTPKAKPLTSTMYYVTLSSAPGCTNRDSVFVEVKSAVTLDAGRDTTVCLTDTFRLKPLSDGLSFSWQPAATLTGADTRTPLAKPAGRTTYTVTARIGSCSAQDDITVNTVPYPAITIGNDVLICQGDSARLSVSGGADYLWIPAYRISDVKATDPVVKPDRTTVYRVAVRDNGGCPKAAFDSVRVTVLAKPVAFAGNDTAIVNGQPLKLQGSGSGSYLWSPPIGLSDPRAPDPAVDISMDMTYALKVTNAAGCSSTDSVRVRVFKTAPDIFVPTAFTPNADRLNDILRPITPGISALAYFRVFNRYGQLVFATDRLGTGWDGTFKGMQQAPGQFVWQVRGTDYTGKVVEKNGTTVLIR